LKKKSNQWVVLLLSSRGEEEARIGNLPQTLAELTSLNREDIYLPIIKNNGVTFFLLEGYVFIKTGYPSSYYYDVVRSPYISSMISEFDPYTQMISKGVISDPDLKKMIAKANSMGGVYQVGSKIKILEGDFKGLSGEIIDVLYSSENTYYCVYVKMRSVEFILKLDAFSLGENYG